MIRFEAPFSLLYHYLRQLSPDAENLYIHGKPTIRASTPLFSLWP
jgi:hypothetical protein